MTFYLNFKYNFAIFVAQSVTVDKKTRDQDLTFFLTSQKAQSDFSRTDFYNLGNTVCTSHCFNKNKQSKNKVYFTIQKFFSTVMRSNAKLWLYSILANLSIPTGVKTSSLL